MHRMRRALAAIKMAEMAELGRTRALADAARSYATDLREQARAAPTVQTAGDMAALERFHLFMRHIQRL